MFGAYYLFFQISLHEYTGLLNNNNKYSQKYLAKNNRIEIECF